MSELSTRIQAFLLKIPTLDNLDDVTRNLPSGPLSTLSSSKESKNSYLGELAEAAESWGTISNQKGKHALTIILENAERFVKDTQLEKELKELLQEVDNNFNQISKQEKQESLSKPSLANTAYTIFISNSGDSELERQINEKVENIRRNQNQAWKLVSRDNLFPNKPPRCCEEYKKAIEECKVYIGVFTSSCGEKDNDSLRLFADYEFEVATERSRRLFIFILGEDSNSPSDEKQTALRSRVRQKCSLSSSTITFFENPQDLKEFEKSLHHYLRSLDLKTYVESSSDLMLGGLSLGQLASSDYDSYPVLHPVITDNDENHIDNFLNEKIVDYFRERLTDTERVKKIESLKRFWSDEGPTLGAFLCFSPADLLKQARVTSCSLRIANYTQRTLGQRILPVSIQDNLLNLLTVGIEIIYETLEHNQISPQNVENSQDLRDSPIFVQNAVRDVDQTEVEFNIPEQALKEALSNALIHRDYQTSIIKNQPILIRIYRHKVEIISYGKPAVRISTPTLDDQLQLGDQATPLIKNCVIGEIFTVMELASLTGEGIKLMHELTRNANLPPPEIYYEEETETVKVIFYRSKNDRPTSSNSVNENSIPKTSASPLLIPSRPSPQKVRDFAVEIRNSQSQEVLGTGTIVSSNGMILTCTHVVKAVIGNRQVQRGEIISVGFPQLSAIQSSQAIVEEFLPENEDDIAILRLIGSPPPIIPSQYVAPLGAAEESIGHLFRCYGFRELYSETAESNGLEIHYSGAFASGEIQGLVGLPAGRSAKLDPIQLKANQIEKGMSGGPIFDVERNLVVGIALSTVKASIVSRDRDTAWAANARILKLSPFDKFNLQVNGS